jgi:hypothetical protein
MIAILAVIAVAAQSTFASLSSYSIEQANDDIMACNRETQTGIGRLGAQYKEVHFECAGGFLRKLILPPDADVLSRDPEEFVKAHWNLFLPKPPKRPLDLRHQRQFDNKFQSSANQFFDGVEIWGAEVFRRNPVRLISGKVDGEKDFGMLYVHLVDTSKWRLKARPALKAEKAEDAARAFDKENGIQAERYQAERVPYFIENFCKAGPALVQRVDAWGRPGGRREDRLRIIPVSVESGKACTWK